MSLARRAARRALHSVHRARERAAIARWTRAIPEIESRLDPPTASFDLSIGAILQDEAPYLREWIEFHRLVGVQHFFLFDDRSTDHPEDVLRPYVEAGLVTLQPLPAKVPRFVFDRQREAYNLCLRRFGPCTRWLAFLDLDEFLYARDEDDLVAVLEDYADAPAVAVNWIFFGTSGHILDPGGLVIEQFTRCRNSPMSPASSSSTRRGPRRS